MSIEGIEAWDNAKKNYDVYLGIVESYIAADLRSQLASIAKATKMLKVFHHF